MFSNAQAISQHGSFREGVGGREPLCELFLSPLCISFFSCGGVCCEDVPPFLVDKEDKRGIFRMKTVVQS